MFFLILTNFYSYSYHTNIYILNTFSRVLTPDIFVCVLDTFDFI